MVLLLHWFFTSSPIISFPLQMFLSPLSLKFFLPCHFHFCLSPFLFCLYCPLTFFNFLSQFFHYLSLLLFYFIQCISLPLLLSPFLQILLFHLLSLSCPFSSPALFLTLLSFPYLICTHDSTGSIIMCSGLKFKIIVTHLWSLYICLDPPFLFPFLPQSALPVSVPHYVCSGSMLTGL